MLPVQHQVSREATYAESPESIFASLVHVEAFPSWRSGIRRVETLPAVEGRRSYREVGKDGTLTYVIDEELPPRRLVSRIADRDLPFGGRWIYELTPSGAGTTLRVTEEGEVYNPLYRFVSRFVLGHDTTINQFLKDLATVYSRPDRR
jgi:uncharacterized protein YndB with AHSA1/START domain